MLRKQKELEECRARAREKSFKQRIEEAEATLRELNEQLQSASRHTFGRTKFSNQSLSREYFPKVIHIN